LSLKRKGRDKLIKEIRFLPFIFAFIFISVSYVNAEEISQRGYLMYFIKYKNPMLGQEVIAEISDAIIDNAKHYNVPVEILAPKLSIESSFDPNAVNPESGCLCMSQINYEVWKEVIPELDKEKLMKDIHYCISTGAAILDFYFKKNKKKTKNQVEAIEMAIQSYCGWSANNFHKVYLAKFKIAAAEYSAMKIFYMRGSGGE
jgi:soluble lytic murein transglycosylase-like protein